VRFGGYTLGVCNIIKNTVGSHSFEKRANWTSEGIREKRNSVKKKLESRGGDTKYMLDVAIELYGGKTQQTRHKTDNGRKS